MSGVGPQTSDVGRRTSDARPGFFSEGSVLGRDDLGRGAKGHRRFWGDLASRGVKTLKPEPEDRGPRSAAGGLTSEVRSLTSEVRRPKPALRHHDPAAGLFRGGDAGGLLGELAQQEVNKGA